MLDKIRMFMKLVANGMTYGNMVVSNGGGVYISGALL